MALPADLYYVGLIESGYNTFVRSRAGATGPGNLCEVPQKITD